MTTTTKAIVIDRYNDNLLRALTGMRVSETELEPPAPDEVIVTIDAAPINPSDIAFIRGGYNIRKPLPATVGFEGTGRVSATGTACRELDGLRVSFFTQDPRYGSWAEKIKVKAGHCIRLIDEIPVEQAACLSINPLTAMGMAEMVVKGKYSTVVLNAAGGQVPSMIRGLLRETGIKIINIVRKEKGISRIGKQPGNSVLCSSDENFPEQLEKILTDSGPALFFDAVAGEEAGRIFNLLPPSSRMVMYGGLSGQPLGAIGLTGIIFKRKTISGFNLNDWLAAKTPEEWEKTSREVQHKVVDGTLSTSISEKFPLSKAVDAIRSYIKDMSAGKVLIVPDDSL
ncbi:MAG: zinc-binding dehydrogenase [Bacteroidales bacterium]